MHEICFLFLFLGATRRAIFLGVMMWTYYKAKGRNEGAFVDEAEEQDIDIWRRYPHMSRDN